MQHSFTHPPNINHMQMKYIRKQVKNFAFAVRILISFFTLLGIMAMFTTETIGYLSYKGLTQEATAFFDPTNYLSESNVGMTLLAQTLGIPGAAKDLEDLSQIHSDPSLPTLSPSESLDYSASDSPQEENKSVILDDLYHFDYESVPTGMFPIIPVDLSQNAAPGELLLSNFTSLQPDIDTLLQADFPIPYYTPFSSDEPLILILHTHGTEAFSNGDSAYYPNESAPRSEDITENVVSLGKCMADVFNARGIPALHCNIMHDLDSYSDAYNLSKLTVLKYLEQYPSIQYIFDVHRDSLVRNDGEKLRPVTYINGNRSAEVMILVGTNENGANFPDWEEHLTLALQIQNLLTHQYDSFARPINLRASSFNQQYAKGSLLLEIGSCGNTLEEAQYAAIALAGTLSDIITGRYTIQTGF